MTRVLLFVTDLKLGGTPTVVRELARRLPAAHVACLGGDDEMAKAIRDDGVAVTAFDCGVAQLPSAVRRLRELVAAERIDVVLSFLVHANVVAALAARSTDGVRWWQSVQTTQPRPRWHWLAQRWAARRAEGIIVPSFGVVDPAVERSVIPRWKFHVIPNGVDEATIAAAPRPPRDPASPLRVVFLGRLDPVKRVPMLVRAVRRLDGVELDVFGDGPERPAIEREVAGDRCVRLHGFATRGRALRDADVLVLPSEAEGFGLALLEAMAAGVPVIGADVPGIRDVIEHETDGLLFSEGELEAARVRVRDEPLEAHERAWAALHWVAEERTWSVIVPRYWQVLDARGPAT